MNTSETYTTPSDAVDARQPWEAPELTVIDVAAKTMAGFNPKPATENFTYYPTVVS